MKPSEQLTEEQKDRIREIAQNEFAGEPFFGHGETQCERAILQALDELVPEMAKDAEQAQWYRWLEKMWPNEITRLVHAHHQEGPTSSELGAAIAAAIAQER